MLGEVVWKYLLQEEDKLEGTNFMDWLEKELGEEEYGKLARDINKAFLNRKEEFCKADYLSLQAAKAQLMTLVTEIMIDKAGFVINEILEDCKKQTDLLKIEKDHLNQ